MFFKVKTFFTESIYADGKPPVNKYDIYREENLILKGISHEEFLNFINDRNRLHDTDLFEYNNLTYNGAEARAKIDVFRTTESVLDEAINTVMSNHPWGFAGGVVPSSNVFGPAAVNPNIVPDKRIFYCITPCKIPINLDLPPLGNKAPYYNYVNLGD